MPDAIYDDDLIERLRAWALKVEIFTPAVGPDFVEGFRDAQTAVLGIIQAGTEPGGSGGDSR